jgi:hypothetical protein
MQADGETVDPELAHRQTRDLVNIRLIIDKNDVKLCEMHCLDPLSEI